MLTAQAISSLACVTVLGAGLYFTTRLFRSKRSSPLPPGHIGWPIIGNLFDISAEKSWEDFAALGRKYGDISTLNMLGTRYIVLNSTNAISDILEKQSAKCSDRPRLTMASLVGFDKVILFINHNDRVRQYRKHFHRLLGSGASASMFNPIEEEETHKFLRKLLRDPGELVSHIRNTAGAIILRVSYGYSTQEGNDPFVDLAEKVMKVLSAVAYPGTFLVDFIPALRYLPEWAPGTEFLQKAKRHHQWTMEAVSRPYQYVVDQMAANKAVPSFTSKLLEGGIPSAEDEDIIMWSSVAIYLGGSDTVVASIHAFFLAMLLYPDVQARAQSELDAVVGNERLPSFDDRDSLPYINAICKEVVRWHCVAPLAMTHVAAEDIYSNGFLIPQGSYIIGNLWRILNDPSTYPDPRVFRPERYLGETPQPDPNICFGFGRRVCPGSRLAEASIFITAAMSLAVLDVSKAVDVDGMPITPEVNVTSGIISHPKPFRFRIHPRSARAEALIDDAQ